MAKGSINKVMILGRLGQDPDIRDTSGGMKVATLSVATTELGIKDQATGQRGQDETEWNRCVLFGRNAENAGTYLKKGSQVYLEGRLRTNKWQDQSGNDRYTTEIVCNEMQFMGGNDSSNQNQQPQNNNQSGVQQSQQYNNQQNQQQIQSNQHQASAQQPVQSNYQQQPNQVQRQPNQTQQQPVQQNQQQSQPQAAQTTGFDDFDSDIPF